MCYIDVLNTRSSRLNIKYTLHESYFTIRDEKLYISNVPSFLSPPQSLFISRRVAQVISTFITYLTLQPFFHLILEDGFVLQADPHSQTSTKRNIADLKIYISWSCYAKTSVCGHEDMKTVTSARPRSPPQVHMQLCSGPISLIRLLLNDWRGKDADYRAKGAPFILNQSGSARLRILSAAPLSFFFQLIIPSEAEGLFFSFFCTK